MRSRQSRAPKPFPLTYGGGIAQPVPLVRAGGALISYLGIVPWAGGDNPGRGVGYLAQTARDEAVALWARGTGGGGDDEAKPESTYGWSYRFAALQWIAHQSSMRVEDSLDWGNLQQWVELETAPGCGSSSRTWS